MEPEGLDNSTIVATSSDESIFIIEKTAFGVWDVYGAALGKTGSAKIIWTTTLNPEISAETTVTVS